MSASLEAKRLAKQLAREGLIVELRRAHYQVYAPDGIEYVATFACTPSDHRWLLNTQAAVKRWRKKQAA